MPPDQKQSRLTRNNVTRMATSLKRANFGPVASAAGGGSREHAGSFDACPNERSDQMPLWVLNRDRTAPFDPDVLAARSVQDSAADIAMARVCAGRSRQ
jgi:hypothetical protein